MNKEEYEKDLKARQEAHLKSLENKEEWKPCLHDQCPNCLGTGKSKFGLCTHSISCDCPKCKMLNQTSTKLNYPYGVRCLTVNPPIYEKYNINPDVSGTGDPLVLRSRGITHNPQALAIKCKGNLGWGSSPSAELDIKSGSTSTGAGNYNSGLTLTNGNNAYCISVTDEGQLDISKVGSCT